MEVECSEPSPSLPTTPGDGLKPVRGAREMPPGTLRRSILMGISRKKLVIAGAGVILLMFASFVPQGLLDQTARPAFCNLCHPMNDQYAAWLLTGVHRGIRCVDCHLPNDNPVNHLVWKGIDGTKDVVSFFSGVYPDRITATNHAKRVIGDNCARCHGEMVSRINTDGMNCWSCHRRMDHNVRDFGFSDITAANRREP